MLREAVFGADSFEKRQADLQALSAIPMKESAFRSFYLEVAPPLQRYIRKTCGNSTFAEDVFQEAFYRFLRADLPEMDGPQMKAYLYRIATSLLIDHWRREKREKFWKSLWMPQEARHGERREDVSRALSALKPAEQALLWLAYVEGFDHSEIASTLKLNEKSVRVLLFRARKKLARAVKRQAGNAGGIS